MKTKKWQWRSFLAAALMFAVCGAAMADGAYIPRPYPPDFDPSFIPPGEPIAEKAAPKVLPFVDDMESGTNGWTATGFWRLIANPENIGISNEINPRLVRLPDSGQLPSSYSGNGCWWYGEDVNGTFIGADFQREQPNLTGGTSRKANSGSLVSPLLDLTGVQNPRLSFWTWYEVEGVDVDRYDMMYVEVSTDGGTTYTKAGAGHINPANDVDGAHWQPYASRAVDGTGLGQVGQWIHVTFDLSQFANSNNVRIRFRFNTVDELYNGFRGWLIDDVRLDGQVTPQPPRITEINPNAGYKNTLVNIRGSGFVNGAVVSLTGPQGGAAPQSYALTTVVVGSEMATATVGNLPVGRYNVKIKNPDDLESSEPVTYDVTQEPAPDITGILPNSGLDTEETPISISGTNFKTGATVTIDDTVPLTDVTVVSSTLIRGKVPAGLAPGYRNVTVTNPDSQYDRLILGFLVIHRSTLTINVIGGGTTNPSAGVHAYDAGTVVPVTAMANNGWTFIRWLGDMGESTDPTLYTSVYNDTTITALFGANLTISTVGQGTTDPVPGVHPITDQSVTLNAYPAEGWRFDRWEGDASGSANPLTLPMDGPKSVRAVFMQEFDLTVEVVGQGTTDPGEGTHTYPVYTQVALSATPAPGWRFDHWEGDLNAAGGLVMDSNKLVRAVFVEQVTLTLAKTGEGSTYPELGTHVYDAGSYVYLSAMPANGWRFDHWEGDLTGNNNPVMVIMDVSKTITAVFVQQHAVTVRVIGGGATDPQVGTYIVDAGTTFDVDALTVEGWRFNRWIENQSTEPSLSLTVNGDTTVTAEYIQQFPLEIAVIGSGSTEPAVGTHLYDAGVGVDIAATADAGHRFDRWVGDVEGTANPVSVTMNGPVSVTAEFVEEPKLTILVEGDGTTSPAEGTHTYAIGTQVAISATPEDEWRFDHWEGDLNSLNASDVVVLDRDKTVKAVFIRQYVLEMEVEGNGTTDPPVGTHKFDAGTVVNVAAFAEKVPGTAGYQFDHWEGDLTGSDNPATITLDDDKELTAFFTAAPPEKVSLTIAVNGGGWTDPPVGTLMVDGPTVENPNPTTTVMATANEGWQFQYWSGDIPDPNSPETNPIDVLNDDNKAVTATFYPVLNITVEGNGTTEPPAGTPVVTATGDTVELFATPAEGWRFDHWEGSITSTSDETSVIMDAPKDVKAVFVRQYTLTVAKTGEGATTPTVGEYTYDTGQTVSVAASPAEGWRFDHWTLQGADAGTSNPIAVVVDGDKDITAVFVRQHKLTIAVSGSGSTDPAAGVYVRDTGATVQVTPTADSGWRFKEWQGAATGSAIPASVTVDADKTLTAVFVQQFPLNITVEGEGTTDPAAGTPHLYDSGAQVPLVATPANGWRFDRWEGDVTGTSSAASVTMNAEKNVKAIFVQQFTLTVAVNGNGSTSPAVGTHVYDTGARVTLAATAAAGSRFVRWTGDASGSDSSVTITMDGNKSVTAEFVAQFALTVDIQGEGTLTPAPGVHVRDAGTVVDLMASPASGWRFDRWEGDVSSSTPSASVTLDANKAVRAVFVQQFALTIEVSGEGTTEPPAGVHVYDVGTQVSITATPADGWLFDRWEGDATGSEPSASVVMDAARTVTAVFAEKPLLAVNPTAMGVDYPAGAVAFNVRNVRTTGAVMPYFAAVVQGGEWLTLDTGVQGIDAGTVRASYTQNTAYESRTGVILITAPNAVNGPLSVTIVQARAPYPAQLRVIPRSQSVGAAEGTTSFTVSNGGELDLTYTAVAVSGTDWMSITGGAVGTNSGVITVAFAANPSVGERIGQIEVTAPGADGSPATATVFQAGREGDGIVEGTVTNSITGAPVEGAVVALTAPSFEGSLQAVSGGDGKYIFSQLTVADPYELAFEAFGYEPATMTGVYQTHNADIALDPIAITRPERPKAISGPRSVFVEWAPNPEFDVKGYNLYRTRVYGATDPTPMETPVKINGSDPNDVYEGLITGTQFRDETVLPGVYYVYQIQAISGQDRPSDYSDPSYPPVKGQWLTIYFPEIFLNNAGLYLWEQAQGTLPNPEVVMPVSFDCAYEVSATGMQLVARIPQALFEVIDPLADITIEPTGVTAGMLFESNVLVGPDDKWEVFMISSDITGRSLYGNGALFYIKAKTIDDTGCGPLELIPFIPGDYPGGPQTIGYPGQQGVRLYDDAPWPKAIDLDLVNGLLCTNGGCLHGDVNNDGVVNGDDASFILKLWTRKVDPNECSMSAGDINLDGYVDSADSTLILRWLAGMNIAPAKAGTKAAEGLAEVSFAAAAIEKTDPEPPSVAVGTVTATGASVAVPITITNAGQMAGCTLVATFPSGGAGLGFASAQLGASFASQGFLMESNFTDADGFGTVRIAITSPGSAGKADAITLVTLNLTVGADAPGNTTLPVNIAAFTLSDQYAFAPKFNAPLAPVVANGGVKLLGGSLTVTITPAEAVAAGAQWSIDGGTTWRNSGETVADLPVGTKTITFKTIAGWQKPSDVDVEIVADQTATVFGGYISTVTTGGLTVLITPAEAVAAGAQWSIDGGVTWNNSGATLPGLPAGSVTVTFKDVANWQKPADVQVLIEVGQTKPANGVYVLLLGSVRIVIEPEGARNAGAGWTVDDDATVHASGQTVGNLTPGNHTIHFVDATPTEGGCFKPGVTWVTPSDRVVTVTGGGLVEEIVTYETGEKSLAAGASGNGDWILLSLVSAALLAGGLRRSRRQPAA
ncbi:MAG TPA: carboxypeptidase regulatory-like domain-containing protein [Candidatus Hydrogenedentes bacterium]|nr:carboxypeptidase regulatory-like domain-containing protein [Candidatus Hydrogenedentota bacterium]HRT20481.1 carboxypeptidase regulatory-like domain-containing protein [Candidatus Hydrogenedentota bacterium]HRT65184.1 carboxypeptidase regulatory-like domain-containing protein [Candidatus Hydrogenedentota bacterium]